MLINKLETMTLETYIDSFSDNPEAVFKDIQEIVSAIGKQELFSTFESFSLDILPQSMGKDPETITNSEMFDLLLTESVKDAENFSDRFSKTWAYAILRACFFEHLITQLKVIHHYSLDPRKMNEIIQGKLSEWYEQEKRETSIIQQLPQLKSKLPESHIMPINRLANELQHDIINRGAFDLVVAGKGTENETTNYTCVTLDNTDGIKMSGKPYTEYDRQVHDAACSLFEYGHPSHIMTSEMVFRAMTHDTETKCPSPQQIGAVAKSMSKMNSIYITTDTTAEMKKLNIPLEEVLIEGHMLEFRTIYVKAGGKKVKAYQMIAEPLLLHYSKQTKQLATVSGELLAVKEVIKDESTGKIKRITDSVIANSEIRIAVKGYLLRRTVVIKNDKKNKSKKQSNIIKFESLFEETGIQKDSKTARNIKEYCYQVLDYWKGMKFIKDYEKRESKGKGRKSIDAVIIKI